MSQLDASDLLHAPSHDQLDLRPRQRIGQDAEVALRERVKAGTLGPDIESGADRHRAGPDQIVLESREQLVQRPLTAGQQRVNVFALGNAGAVLGLGRQRVALEDQHRLEVVGERPRRGQPAHPCANDDRALVEHYLPGPLNVAVPAFFSDSTSASGRMRIVVRVARI